MYTIGSFKFEDIAELEEILEHSELPSLPVVYSGDCSETAELFKLCRPLSSEIQIFLELMNEVVTTDHYYQVIACIAAIGCSVEEIYEKWENASLYHGYIEDYARSNYKEIIPVLENVPAVYVNFEKVIQCLEQGGALYKLQVEESIYCTNMDTI